MPRDELARTQSAVSQRRTGPKETTLEDMQFAFRPNFGGRAEQYNEKGQRNFTILLDDALAEAMERDGWKVKRSVPKNDDYDAFSYLPVKVSYREVDGIIRGPRVILLTSNGRNPLTVDTVAAVDLVDVDSIDITIAQYPWNVNGNSGIKTYLRTAYVRVREDPLDLKYAGWGEAKPELEDIVDAEIIDDEAILEIEG